MRTSQVDAAQTFAPGFRAYSRYARGLGLTGEPGAHDLPHSGCAVVAVPPARWDAAEQKYRAWAEKHGWALWRIGARPTVVVPDPVVHALGVRAAGRDSLVFARAAPPVVPAIGRRVRGEGMSFPLSPGDRWLIATDRVRRRMRTEVARQGLVLFVDEAEWLAPAGLAVLMYLVDAHRAWRARMLSRPARVYVVLATAPEHEAGVLRMLQRFDLTGHTPVVRERRKEAKGGGGTAPPPALRDVEEEHIFGALAAAPAALAKDDVRAVFGASAIDRCLAMAERGLLHVRTEAGEECFVPNVAVPSAHVSAAPRALRAIDACYRRRAKRGHEHLVLARAALALELGDSLRAAGLVARMSHAAGALLPYRLFDALDSALERARPRLKADHAAAWFSLAAHQRAYDHAREIANLVTEREMRTWKEALRVVEVVLCSGRTHLDTCLPPDFWPRLKSESLAGPFMDATCVLGELFWRKRYLDDEEIRQRYEFVCDCFARWDRPRSAWFERLERLVRITTYRAALHLGVPSRILSIARDEVGAPQETLRSFLRRNQVPAYVAAAPMFAESALGYVCPPRSFDYRDKYLAVRFTATTGQPEDMLITTGTTVSHLSEAGMRLLLRDVLDNVLLLTPRRANPCDRHQSSGVLRTTAGGRLMLVGANALYLAHGRSDVPGRDASNENEAAHDRMIAGDLVGARDLLAAGLATRPRCPITACALIKSQIVLLQKSLDRRGLGEAAAVIEQNRALLAPDLHAYLVRFLEGSRAVCGGDFQQAARHFLAAGDAIKNTLEWAVELKSAAVRSSYRAHRTSQLLGSWSQGGRRPDIWSEIRALCRGPEWRRASPSLRVRTSLCLDHIWWLLEAWSLTVDHDELLRMSFFLQDAVDAVFRPLGRDFVGLLSEWAPNFFERLRAALVARVGELHAAVPETRAVGAALRTIEDTWKSSQMASVDDRCAIVVLSERGSRVREAKAASLAWYDDAVAYAQLRDEAGRVVSGTFSRVAYGYVGKTAARPVATTLDFRVTPRENGRFEVHVEAAARPPHARGGSKNHEPVASFVGQSAAAGKVRAAIETASKCGYAALILGETGVGKDLVARCIHAGSASRGRALVVAECTGLAESLLESELFGHEKGAFTGAHARHDGFFARANGSTLLLDEVDSMSARMQASLLRVLEKGEYRPVGASSARTSEFRLISAALPRLPQMVEAGAFRRDLYYRISTLRIEIPPLREREGDAGEIATAFARTLGFRLTAGALRSISQYEWPGNVRQLRHAIQAASLHANDGRIGEAALSEVITGYRGAATESSENGRGLDAVWARAVRALERKAKFGVWEFAQAAGLSRRSAQRYVAHLLRDGRIKRLGAGRTTRYAVKT